MPKIVTDTQPPGLTSPFLPSPSLFSSSRQQSTRYFLIKWRLKTFGFSNLYTPSKYILYSLPTLYLRYNFAAKIRDAITSNLISIKTLYYKRKALVKSQIPFKFFQECNIYALGRRLDKSWIVKWLCGEKARLRCVGEMFTLKIVFVKSFTFFSH